MDISVFFLYVAAIFVVIIIPGPLSLLMINNTLKYGMARSYPAFLGGVSASVALLLISALGVGALILASPTLFSAIKTIGAIYLIYLGYKAWADSRHPSQSSSTETTSSPKFGPMFRQAFLLGASNPKDIAFFVAFLPQFIDSNAALMPQLTVMVLTWMAVDLTCKWIYGAIALAGAKGVQTIGSIFPKVAAVLFVSAGVATLVSKS